MKKVLFVTYDFPYPTNTGGKNRVYHMLKHSGADIKKYLFSFTRDDSWESFVKEMNEIGVEVVGTKARRKVIDPRNIFGLLRQDSIFKTLYYSKSILADLLRIVRGYRIDIVHFESFYTSFYIPDLIERGVKQIFGTENIEFKVYQDYARRASFLLKPLYDLQVQKIKEEETSLFKKADLCIAVSEPDARQIRKYAKECEIIRNGVDLDEFKFEFSKSDFGKNLLFVGNFSYFPNVDAINYFYDEVFRQLHSDIRLTIIGKKVHTLKFLDDNRIEAIEFIPKIQDVYKKADIMLSPVRLGGGTNFKILEAMAMGVPVVSLPHRLEGLDVSDNENILVANDAKEFKEAIERLVGKPKLREKIARNARKLVEREYSWRVIGNNLNIIWTNL